MPASLILVSTCACRLSGGSDGKYALGHDILASWKRQVLKVKVETKRYGPAFVGPNARPVEFPIQVIYQFNVRLTFVLKNGRYYLSSNSQSRSCYS